jgi:hypothetical protein
VTGSSTKSSRMDGLLRVPSAFGSAVFVLCRVLTGCGGEPLPDPPDTGNGGESRDAAASDAAPEDNACPNDLPEGDNCTDFTPGYELRVAPIIEQRCVTCHFPDNSRSQYVFSDYEGVFAARRTVLTRIYGCVMPPAGAPQLTPDERRILLTWLVCGAPDN